MKVKIAGTEINIFEDFCEQGKCRSNCKKNPNCFRNLGEKFWCNEIKNNVWVHTEIDPEHKEKNKHVGLKNLGATCYVNTFLQLWFHNKAFRSFVYQWKPQNEILALHDADNEDAKCNTITLEFGGNPMDAICGNLQYLFALLEYSEKRYVDPGSFVRSLGLQTDEQQDAQEFSKLFVHLLGDALSMQVKTSTNIIENQCGGSYIYRTTCNACGSVSKNESKFLELDLNIKGHVMLKECLKEFLKEEVLTGDNQYFCSPCQSKQDARRNIVLKTLPTVLNLQLLRFVFERETGSKKKLNNIIAFPDVLDMNEFQTFENHEDGIYILTGVLIHRGLTAHSGHYIAHIYDEENELWSRFNDEDVTHMKGKHLELGREEDVEEYEVVPKKRRKKLEGRHTSKNAYMLVYKKRSADNNSCPHVGGQDVPENMKEFVVKDNSLFGIWYSQKKRKQEAVLEEGRRKQVLIQSIYNCLPAGEGADYEWISTEWLRQWLNADLKTVPPIDNTSLICCHSRVDPSKLMYMKRISGAAAERLFTNYGGLPRLKSDALCCDCLGFLKRKDVFENKLNDDSKRIVKPLKTSYKSPAKGYWVGKKSLKRFKHFALKHFLENEGANSYGECEIVLSEQNSTNSSSSQNNNKVESQIFNEDILCAEHDQLSTITSNRIMVSAEIWNQILEYLPHLKPYAETTKVCHLCTEKDKTSLQEKETIKILINEQKQALSFLNSNLRKQLQLLMSQDNITLHVILVSFINKWNKSLRGLKLMKNIRNKEILCQHDHLLYTPEEIIDEACKDDGELCLLTSDQFCAIKQTLHVDHDISITIKTLVENEGMESHTSIPEFCPECRDNRLTEEANDSSRFVNATIFVEKKIISRNTNSISIPFKSEDVSDKNMSCEREIDEDDIPKSSSQTTPKKSPKQKKTMCFENRGKLDEPRRSKRYRSKRGENAVKVDSFETLKCLKRKLLQVFCVLPIEQTLVRENGTVLSDDSSSLLELGIQPGDHVILQVDEATNDITSIEEPVPGDSPCIYYCLISSREDEYEFLTGVVTFI